MMFDKYCINKILCGEKTVTRRLIKPNQKRPAIPGKIHKLKIDRTKKTFGYIKILKCDVTRVKQINNSEAIKEGFENKEKYIKYFMNINNINSLNKEDCLWRVEFELV